MKMAMPCTVFALENVDCMDAIVLLVVYHCFFKWLETKEQNNHLSQKHLKRSLLCVIKRNKLENKITDL